MYSAAPPGPHYDPADLVRMLAEIAPKFALLSDDHAMRGNSRDEINAFGFRAKDSGRVLGKGAACNDQGRTDTEYRQQPLLHGRSSAG
jgi:hypothetical protein